MNDNSPNNDNLGRTCDSCPCQISASSTPAAGYFSLPQPLAALADEILNLGKGHFHIARVSTNANGAFVQIATPNRSAAGQLSIVVQLDSQPAKESAPAGEPEQIRFEPIGPCGFGC